MGSILNRLSEDHRHCDEYFVALEQALAQRDFAGAGRFCEKFKRATLAHLAFEELVLFPAFEIRSGMKGGPTAVMRQEHGQIRQSISAIEQALGAGEADECASELDSLFILLQQHNLKEESILYPMCDHHLADQVPALFAAHEGGGALGSIEVGA